MKTLGEIIKEYRQENSLSLREFSKKCGLSHTYIDKLEKGVDPRSGKPVEPTIDVLEKVSSALSINLQELLILIGKIESTSKNIDIKNNKLNIDENEKDVEELLEETMSQILNQDGLMLNGQIVDDNDLILLRNALKNGIEYVKSMKSKK